MTKAELLKEIEELKARVEALEEDEKPKTVWDLKKGDTYYLLDAVGLLYDRRWDNGPYDNDARKQGNVFLSAEAARDADRARKLISAINREHGDWKPDWNNRNLWKYLIYYDHKTKKLDSNPAEYSNSAPMFGWLEDEEKADEIIEKYREDLTWFFTEYRQ